MPTTLSTAIERIRERAEGDPDFASVVLHLADGELADPFKQPDSSVVRLARDLNRDRQLHRAADRHERSLATHQVVALIESISDRKGVDRRRRRGALLGIRVGRDTLHPAWQFDLRRRETWDGLRRILTVLQSVAADDIDVDAIATAPLEEYGGCSIADLLAAGNIAAAERAAALAGDQS